MIIQNYKIITYLQFEIKNDKGKTPFFIAVELFDRQICRVLIEWGCNVFTKNSYQKSALELINNEKFRFRPKKVLPLKSRLE